MKQRIKITQYHQSLDLVRKEKKMPNATRDLFSIVIILKILLEKEEFNKFYIEIMEEIQILRNSLTKALMRKVLYKMGFPKNYKELLHL